MTGARNSRRAGTSRFASIKLTSPRAGSVHAAAFPRLPVSPHFLSGLFQQVGVAVPDPGCNSVIPFRIPLLTCNKGRGQ